MNKKIKQYSTLALVASAILPLSCGKDSDKNDENIDDRTINKVLNAVVSGDQWQKEDSIDVNGDGQFDFSFTVDGEIYGSNSYGSSGIEGKNAGNQLLSNDLTVGAYTLPFATVKNSGDKINSSSVTWENRSYIGYKYNTTEVGPAGDGDKLYGFRFTLVDGVHYGWMKVNVAEDYKTLTIKELAFHKTPNTEIEAGAK